MKRNNIRRKSILSGRHGYENQHRKIRKKEMFIVAWPFVKAKILRANLRGDPNDPRRTFIREDWKGADCQILFNDPEEADAEPEDLFEADYVRAIDESGKRSREVIVVGPTCLSTIPHADSSDSDSQSEEESDNNDDQQELADGLWLMDTGSGHDLTTPSGAENCDMQKVRKIVFSTANGRISTERAVNLISNILRGPATPPVLPETPWVLSIGKRVMQMGYSVVWIAKTNPWLIAPDGHRIDLEVHGNIPFLRVGNVSAAALSNIAPK